MRIFVLYGYLFLCNATKLKYGVVACELDVQSVRALSAFRLVNGSALVVRDNAATFQEVVAK